MKPIQVGLLGIGTVGQRRLQRPASATRKKSSAAPAAASRSPWWPTWTRRAPRPSSGDGVKVVNDARAVIANPDIDIVIELIGGYGIAKQLVMEAIEAGKHVVTANKALLAVHGTEIFAAAHRQGRDGGV